MRSIRLRPLALLLIAACAREPSPPGSRTPTPTPLPALTEASVRMLVDVERAVAESEAERDRARRQHGRAISESGQLSAGPPIKATDQVATALGHDPVLYWRAKQRVGELEVLQLEANERHQNQRFREGHLEALRRALASTTDDGERARLKGSIETVEEGLRRGAEADRYLAELAPELELVERYLAASSAE